MKTQQPNSDQPYLTIESSSTAAELSLLNTDEIKGRFKEYGAILFRGFPLDIERFAKFSDQFCNKYVSNESPGREILSPDGRVQTVNLGDKHFPLHPEMSREPWQPDIAFFACKTAAKIGGETTVCDGVEAVKAFPSDLVAHLKENTLAHEMPTTMQWCADFLGKDKLQLTELIELSDDVVQFSVKNGSLVRTYFRPMLHKPMFSNEWAYGSFLVFARRNLYTRHFPTYADGSEVPDKIVEQIESITNSLARGHSWQTNDLLMLDNTRFIHGRNPIGDPYTRRIYTQFGYSSFVPNDYPGLAHQKWRQPEL